jgi:hypothetical protein
VCDRQCVAATCRPGGLPLGYGVDAQKPAGCGAGLVLRCRHSRLDNERQGSNSSHQRMVACSPTRSRTSSNGATRYRTAPVRHHVSRRRIPTLNHGVRWQAPRHATMWVPAGIRLHNLQQGRTRHNFTQRLSRSYELRSSGLTAIPPNSVNFATLETLSVGEEKCIDVRSGKWGC